MARRTVMLYVKSVKTLVGTEGYESRTVMGKIGSYPDRVELEGKRMKGTFQIKAYQTETQPEYEFILPEAQRALTEMAKKLCRKHDFELRIIGCNKRKHPS